MKITFITFINGIIIYSGTSNYFLFLWIKSKTNDMEHLRMWIFHWHIPSSHNCFSDKITELHMGEPYNCPIPLLQKFIKISDNVTNCL